MGPPHWVWKAKDQTKKDYSQASRSNIIYLMRFWNYLGSDTLFFLPVSPFGEVYPVHVSVFWKHLTYLMSYFSAVIHLWLLVSTGSFLVPCLIFSYRSHHHLIFCVIFACLCIVCFPTILTLSYRFCEVRDFCVFVHCLIFST